ncbi:response regulator [Bizionia argentinensis JUB59]|uniref:Response regulator n=2 Tax=Bizionia TaxID=283785 RepID=G2EHK1_9FLAO|nr:response regulator [Bizionia argentinensis JUB59]
MLIDDNKIDLFVNQRIIEKYNPEVKTRVFNNGNSALSFLKLLDLKETIESETIPSVILLDINMPEMSGFNFFKEFKQLSTLLKNKIEVYILSSSTSPDDVRKAQNESLCAGYITKPLTVDKLKSLLDKSVNMIQDEPFKKIV